MLFVWEKCPPPCFLYGRSVLRHAFCMGEVSSAMLFVLSLYGRSVLRHVLGEVSFLYGRSVLRHAFCMGEVSSAMLVVWDTNATSRWKDQDQVNGSGVRAGKMWGVEYWLYDWQTDRMTERKYQINADRTFYKQQYCGCSYSMRDSNAWRAENGMPPIKIGTTFYEDPVADAAEESREVVEGFFAEFDHRTSSARRSGRRAPGKTTTTTTAPARSAATVTAGRIRARLPPVDGVLANLAAGLLGGTAGTRRTLTHRFETHVPAALGAGPSPTPGGTRSSCRCALTPRCATPGRTPSARH